MIFFKKCSYPIFISFLFLILPFLGGGSLPPLDENFLGLEIDLAHWDFEDVSEVGYLSLGIYHKKTGDELVVYDIREEKPVIQQPSKPLSRIPPILDGIFLLDDFQHGNINRLGGYFSSIVRTPSESHVTIHAAPDGQRSLCFTYNKKSSGFAGFWIHLFDFKLPPIERVFLDASPFRFLTFEIRGELGEEKLSLQVADYAWEKKEDSLKIGNVGEFLPTGKIQKEWQRAWVPLTRLPERINKEELASLVFLAQPGRGKVFLGDVAFTEVKDAPISEAAERKVYKSSPHRGMWLWNTKELLGRDAEQKRLVEFCGQNSITEIFLQLPYDTEENKEKRAIHWDTAKVAALLSHLHDKGIKVHALDGDPRFALREWHGHVLSTIQAVIHFNQTVQPNERFDGVRYDNEPYLLPYFAGVIKESILEQYMELLRLSKALTSAAHLEFGVDIPFWFDQKNEFFESIAALRARPLTECIMDVVDNVGIMAYRTKAYGADGVIAHALGELRYASEKGKKVFIGLETGTLPDETLLEFGRGRGPSRIHFTKREGSRVLLQWVPEGSNLGIKSDWSLSLRNKIFVPAGKLTFADKSIGELTDIMEKAESEFQEYPAFYGFAIHYYESFQTLLSKNGNN